ncbi:hypothetical protein E2C01_089797 [Portunus trituberculatus]|uniref:Uncharacterized protein n=1 Tax=Portunus trituberculatus TaxID=210409 RepID=A0A5B7JD07_PORTR|nr:hypothetical protein [Portunus trituberculatus]
MAVLEVGLRVWGEGYKGSNQWQTASTNGVNVDAKLRGRGSRRRGRVTESPAPPPSLLVWLIGVSGYPRGLHCGPSALSASCSSSQ